MKTFLSVTVLLFAYSFANSQGQSNPPRGDTCASCGIERSDPQRDISAQDRTRVASSDAWPIRPEVANRRGSPYRVVTTNFLVNNDSDKEIRTIKWTATLINRETKETIQTFPLETRKKIGPHKSAKLKEKLVVPVKKLRGKVVSATQPNDPKEVAVDEKYEIVEIVYADKTTAKP